MKNSNKVEFYKHNVGLAELAEFINVIKGYFLTTGPLVESFEKKLAEYLNVKYAVGLMSCTHALEMALAFFAIGPGDEVITTPLSYTATADAIEHVGAKPIFVDVEKETGNINIDLIEDKITERTKAIIPVHLYGQMVDMVKLNQLAKKYHLKIIEDAAHCLEGTRDHINPGQLSDAACFSFYATKAITSGEGGAICTNDPNMFAWLKMARSHGINKEVAQRHDRVDFQHYDKEFLGFKANMSNIQASLLINQLDRTDKYLTQKEKICEIYDFWFGRSWDIKLLKKLANVKHARHLYTILVPEKIRDKMIIKLRENGIGINVNYLPIHLLSYYRLKYGFQVNDFPEAELIGRSTISLPFYSTLKTDEIKTVIKSVLTSIKQLA